MNTDLMAEVFLPEPKPVDSSEWGIVRAVNADGSYQVQLRGSSALTCCAPYCTAIVGDKVKVTIKANGKCDAIGRLGGDLGGGGSSTVQYDDVSNYIAGRVFAYAGTDEPFGCLPCDGSAVSRTTYWELFAAIGTTYGVGDGSSTFNLPNIESRTIIGEGVGESGTEYKLGEAKGNEEIALTAAIGAVNNKGHYLGYAAEAVSAYQSENAATFAMASTAADPELWNHGTIVTEHNSTNRMTNIMQPYIVMRYFITTGKGNPVSGINPADYVVEWGTTGEWRWEKWASGKAECWGVFYEEGNTPYTTWNNMPFRYTPYWAFPFEFVELPSVSYAGYIGSGFAIDARAEVLTTSVRLFFATSATGSEQVEAHIQAKGYWRTPSESGGTETIAPTIEARFEALENEAVVASGTSGSWEWIKFASGLAICAGQKITNEASFGSWNGMPAYLTTEYYPFAFVGTPASLCTMRAVGQFSVNGYTYGDATQWKGVGYAGGSGNDCYWTMLAVGRWK